MLKLDSSSMSKSYRLRKPKRIEYPLEVFEVARRVENLLSKPESSSTMEMMKFTTFLFSIFDREKNLLVAHTEKSSESCLQGNRDLMRKIELLSSEYYQKECNKDKLHELRGTLCDKYSDQVDRLHEKGKEQGLQNSLKTHEPMNDLNNYSRHLEEKTRYNLECAGKNESLKAEFQSFYDTYRLGESRYDHELGEQKLRIEKLTEEKRSTGCTVDAEQNVLSSLEGRLLSAQKKDTSLKMKLQDVAAKLEMFTGLLNDSNMKFASVKVDMNSKTEFSKSLTHEISEFKKKIAQTNILMAPTHLENVHRVEIINKVLKQIDQLEALHDRLHSQSL